MAVFSSSQERTRTAAGRLSGRREAPSTGMSPPLREDCSKESTKAAFSSAVGGKQASLDITDLRDRRERALYVSEAWSLAEKVAENRLRLDGGVAGSIAG